MCLPCCCPAGRSPGQFAAQFVADSEKVKVQGLISDICDKIGCDRLFFVHVNGVCQSIAKYYPEANESQYRPVVEQGVRALLGCDPITLILTILRLLGMLTGGVSFKQDDLQDCADDLQRFLNAAQQIINWLNTCLGGLPPIPNPPPNTNPCPCGPSPSPPGPGGVDYKPSDQSRGC